MITTRDVCQFKAELTWLVDEFGLALFSSPSKWSFHILVMSSGLVAPPTVVARGMSL